MMTEQIKYGASPEVRVKRAPTLSPLTVCEWAAQLGSRARTREGAIRAIMAHIRAIEPKSGVSSSRAQLEVDAWLPELATLRLRHIPATRAAWRRWYRVARCLRNGRYLIVQARDIPRRTTFFCGADGAAQVREVYVFPGHLRPMVFGHGCGFKWRGQWKHARGSYIRATWVGVCGQQTLAAYLAAPGRIGHPAALTGECARRDAAVYRRWRWTGAAWEPSGVAVPMPADLQAAGHGRYEHGASAEECRAEIERKRRIEAERRARAEGQPLEQVERRMRAARLLARIGRRIHVTADDVRAAGACGDGIAAWCRAHGVRPSEGVPLARLYRDAVARPYALRIAERLVEGIL